ncbi:uncharacterized protein LOC135342233 isoform X1 [Halichondria panicea]|uniref:uncharacterized protein LOC135342233 isoform X1 n=1 Tax=Halichondria panicea TaxID=6063 RepID=UPI00312B6565
MRHRIATLILTIIVITFVHKKASCNTQITDVTPSSAGNRFVVGFPINFAEAEQLFLFITNPESSAVSFTVTPIDFSGSVSASSATVNIPSSFEVVSINERDKGILVEANGNINVYGLSYDSGSADAYLALPCTVMAVDEYEYYGISYGTFCSIILVVACENETVIKFNSSTITLNSMETYQMESSDNDLTGTRITSSKPLSVFSGHDCANIPQGNQACDHLVEQVPPTVTWGSKFFVASLEGRSSGERIRVLSARAASVAVNCNTNVSVSEFQLQSGGSYREFEILINSFCSIESTSPVLVAQYAYGGESDGVGDPFMMIIPPIEQFTNNYLVESFTNFISNHVTVYVSFEFFQTAQIFLDNSIVTDWRNVVCASGEICGHISRTNVSTGAHSVRHQNSSAVLGVSVYGFDIDNSYGYPGGMRLSPIHCNCGQNSICLNNMGQFNCSCLIGFGAKLTGTDGFTCNAISCPLSTAPTNGSVTYSATADENDTYAFDVVVTYSCFVGFSLVGDNTRTCTGDGSSTTGAFSGIDPTCEPITCSPLMSPTNGTVSYGGVATDVNGNFTFNVIATYSCETGFALVDNSSRICTGDGMSVNGDFNGTAPTCDPITCPAVAALSSGSIDFSGASSDGNSNYAFDVVANYNCDNGFSLVGNSSRTCTGDGSSTTGVFDGIAPICAAITCPPLSNLTNGSLSYSNVPGQNNSYAFNVDVTYSCDTGFALVGNNTRTCTGDGSSTTGSFDGEAPTCEVITCPPLSDPSNGSVVHNIDLEFGSQAIYNCNTGFFLVGNTIRTCTGDGSNTTGYFDGEAPTCEDVTLSSSGNTYVVGFPRNFADAEQLFLFITNPESSAVSFLVTPINFSCSVSTSSTTVNIPSSFEVVSVDERNKGILVEANGNVRVYGLSYDSGSADAYLALPCTVMAVDEYEYYGISYGTFCSIILVVACENETVVKFNNSVTITLNSLETYQFESSSQDLTGTRITSSKPLSVFSGHDCAAVPQDINFCDHLVEQVPPTVTWGSKFFVASLEGRSSGERIRVLSARAASVAVNCNTNVSVSEFQLQSGGSYREFEILINSFCSIESTSPVLVAQYAYGGESDGVGDPFMMIIPPIEQFTNNYLVESFTNFISNHVTVYVSFEFFQTAQIFLDNSIVTDWRNVVCASGEICGHISRTNVSTGAHSVRHQNSSAVLGVSVYGFGIDNSYGYPGGMRLSPIHCNCGQNSICLNNMGQFNCSCLIGFGAKLTGTDGFTCNAITCPLSTAPTNGSVTYSATADENDTYAFDVVVTYSCFVGFFLVGDNTRTCTGDGSSTTGAFSGIDPTCEPITCSPLMSPTNGTVSYGGVATDVNGNFTFNVMATYSCNTGFALVDNSSRICTGGGMSVNGGFNGTAPTCDPITCPAVAAPSSGSIDFGGASSDGNSNYAFDVVANYNCDNGFSLVGNSSRTCTGLGSSTAGAFDGAAPSCEPITCPGVLIPNNGNIDFGGASRDENGTYIFAVVATYVCDTGFYLVGNDSRTCTGDGSSIIGTFDGSASTCQLITCPPLTIPSNGAVTYNSTADENGNYDFYVMATYNCDTGFFLVGDNSTTCTGNGSSITGAFDGLVPICESITCPPLSNLTNGSLSYSNVPDQNNSYAFNVTATYRCNSGFALVGNKTRNCSGDGSSTTGSFDASAPTCKAITCSPIADPINGTVIYSSDVDGLGNYVFNVTANHSCDTGFDLVGNNPRTCSGDGSSITGAFDGEDLKCEVLVASSASLIRDVVIPVVSVVAVLALVVLGGAVYGYIQVISHLLKLKKSETGTAKLL